MTDLPQRDYEAPTPVNLSRADVSAIADNVRRKVEYNPGQPLEPVVARLGGEIRYVDTNDNSGSIYVVPEKFWICIPLDTGLLRDRFTIAHELGHYVLHYLYQRQRKNKPIQYLRAERYGTGKAEYEANWFAAGFLMPADVFRQKFAELGEIVPAVAQFFEVSTQAAQVRAESLNLL